MILVSGASGLVGTAILNQLLSSPSPKIRALYRHRQSKTRALKNLARSHPPEKLAHIEWFQVDINKVPRLNDAFDGVKEVYHCAGYIAGDENEAEITRKINMEGTANMINLALNRGVEKFCHTSSIAALGSEIGNRTIDENSPRNNDKAYSSYALSKFGAEMEAWRGSEEGLNVIIVNPGVIIGAGNWHTGSGQFFSRIDKGFNYHLPKVSGFVGGDDVAEAMVSLMKENCFGRRYILVAENASLKQVMTRVAKALHKKPPQRALKPWMISIAWMAQSVGSLLWNGKKEFTRDSISSLFDREYYSSKRIEEELNFRFQPMDRVIADTAEIYKAQKKES